MVLGFGRVSSSAVFEERAVAGLLGGGVGVGGPS